MEKNFGEQPREEEPTGKKEEVVELLEKGGYSETVKFPDTKEGRKQMDEYTKDFSDKKVFQTIVSKGEEGMVWRFFERDKREGEE